jgi:sulfite exporter TauE/SafE
MDHAAHLAQLNASAPPVALMAGLFLAGLFGSAAHCATMCSPFVLAQLPVATGDGETPNSLSLVRAALLPYHLGRATTYAALGAGLGGLGAGLIQSATFLRTLLPGFLLLAAFLFLTQAIKEAGLMPMVSRGSGATSRVGTALARLTRPLVLGGGGIRGYFLGVALGFLPCGLLYGALAAAAGTGSALGGALAMTAFAVATMPALISIGCLGVGLAYRWRALARTLLAPIQAVNAVLLAAMAVVGPHGLMH